MAEAGGGLGVVAEAGIGLGVVAEAGSGLGVVAEAGIGLGVDFGRCWEVPGGVGPTQGSSLPGGSGTCRGTPRNPPNLPRYGGSRGPRLAQSV